MRDYTLLRETRVETSISAAEAPVGFGPGFSFDPVIAGVPFRLGSNTMTETHITRSDSRLRPKEDLSASGKFFVDDTPARSRTTICNLLQYDHTDADSTYYSIIGYGCVTIYLSDGNGNVVSSTTFQGIPGPGQVLRVDGPHGFGCNC